VPVAARSASTSVVFPEPEWPTSTTLRTLLGSSTTGAGPATPFSWLFCAITRLPSHPLSYLLYACDTAHVDGLFRRSHTPNILDTTPTRILVRTQLPRYQREGGAVMVGAPWERSSASSAGRAWRVSSNRSAAGCCAPASRPTRSPSPARSAS